MENDSPENDFSWQTCGHWTEEQDAENDFCTFCVQTGAFKIYRQIVGEPLWKRFSQMHKSLRADVLLLPLQPLLNAGWTNGIMLIEIKRSGEKIGPGCSQLLDYMNAAFVLPSGIAVLPTFGFLFPARKQRGAIASIMAQQRIGTAMIQDDGLDLFCGENRVLTIRNGQIQIGNTVFGKKLGSR